MEIVETNQDLSRRAQEHVKAIIKTSETALQAKENLEKYFKDHPQDRFLVDYFFISPNSIRVRVQSFNAYEED